MNKPQHHGLDKAKKKLERLASRGARKRVLTRLATRIERLKADYERRLKTYRKALGLVLDGPITEEHVAAVEKSVSELAAEAAAAGWTPEYVAGLNKQESK